MNIAFDSVAILGPNSINRGIGNYARDQFLSLIHQDKDNHYFFFNVFHEEKVFLSEERKGLVKEDDFLCVKGREFLNAPRFDDCYEKLVRNYIIKNKINVFYITSPFDGHTPSYKKEWMEGATVVATVYDIIPYMMKDRYFPQKGQIDWYMERIEMLRWVDRLLVISQCVKDDMVNYLHFDPDRIDVIWGAPSDMFRKVDISPSDEKQIKTRYGIFGPFVMCTGGNDERKNIAGLIQAYSQISKDLISQYQLVIVCKLDQASVERYTELARSSGVGGRVVLTNFVSDEELIVLYNLADLVAFPSVYEGFGLPVVEAWACGTGVLTSNNSSLGQIAGDAAITVDPYSVDSISKGIEKALSGDLKELAKKGEERLLLFTWEKVAEYTKKAIEQAALSEKQENQEHIRRERIAFFSPFSPAQRDICAYCSELVNTLADSFDIDIYTDRDDTSELFPDARIHVYNYTHYPAKRKQYSETIYQIDNSEYHEYMWPFIQKWGGLVDLHDSNLHGALQRKYLGKQSKPHEYLAALKKDLSEQDYKLCMNAVGNPSELDELKRNVEVNGFIIDYADKVIVHSDEINRKLLEKDIRRSVRMVECHKKNEPIADAKQAKNEWDIRYIARQYEEYIHEKPSHLVNEELLRALRERTISLRMNSTEIKRLAHTLAYIK